jgi:4-hydroxy-3-polyprenylbenzoate decarboxylase
VSRPVVVGITGASGSLYGLRLLDALRAVGREAHVVITGPGAAVARHETGLEPEQIAAKAARAWDVDDLFAPIASGSFLTGGMVVAPCSVRTLSAVAEARSTNLLERAADVTLKERRPLVLLVRETPLHLGHLRLMTRAAEAGAVIAPPVPAFYSRPTSVDDLVDHTVARVLDLLGVDHDLSVRWREE